MKASGGIWSVGWASVLGYFGLFYYLPLALMAWFGPHQQFNNAGHVLPVFLVVSAVLVSAAMFVPSGIRLPTRWTEQIPNIFEKKALLFLIGIASLPISIKFFSEFGAGFRYSGVGQTGGGFIAQYALLYRAFFFSFLLYIFLGILQGRPTEAWLRMALGLHTLNWMLCANSTADLVGVMVGAYIALIGDKGRSFFVASSPIGTRWTRRLMRRVLLLFSIVTLGISFIFFGYANKMGVERALELFSLKNIGIISYYIYYRLAMFISATELILSRGFFDPSFYERSVSTLVSALRYRAEWVLGLSPIKPEVGGINQMNYYDLFKYPTNDRSGSSAGPVGTFLYFPFFPVNLMVCAAYIAAVVNSYSRSAPMLSGSRPTFISIFFMIIISYALLHNPVEAFISIGPELFRIILTLYVLEKAASLAAGRTTAVGLPNTRAIPQGRLQSA